MWSFFVHKMSLTRCLLVSLGYAHPENVRSVRDRVMRNALTHPSLHLSTSPHFPKAFPLNCFFISLDFLTLAILPSWLESVCLEMIDYSRAFTWVVEHNFVITYEMKNVFMNSLSNKCYLIVLAITQPTKRRGLLFGGALVIN